jgi:hypothetical protein
MKSLYDEYSEKLAEIPKGPNPLDVACPHCRTKADFRCGYGQIATHKARYKAVGLDKPTIDDTRREFFEGELRRMRREQAVNDKPQEPATPKF